MITTCRPRRSTTWTPRRWRTTAQVLAVLVPFTVHLFPLGRTTVHQTVSLTLDSSTKKISAQQTVTDLDDSSQLTSKVKMREHSSKKKKTLRDLKSRISLPPELKNGFSLHKQPSTMNNSNNASQPQHPTSGMNATNKFKLNHQPLPQRSSYYQTNSLSTQTLNRVLHQSNSSLLRLSPSQLNTSTNGQLSRNEQRLSMLDLGFGRIESYIKLEKLGEGEWAERETAACSNRSIDFFVVRYLCNCLQGKISFAQRLHRIEGDPAGAGRR